MKQRAFEIGVAIMMFGATAMDSEGVGWIIAAGMVIAGAVIAHVAYTLERVEKSGRKPSVAYSSYGKPVERRKMHISEIKRMYLQYPNKASNLTYPRKEKKNDGDFKEMLDVEIKKMESADQSNDSI